MTFKFLCLISVAFIGGALFFLQQFAGINGVLYFSSLTFRDVGITNVALASLVIGITNFAGMQKKFLLMKECKIYFLGKCTHSVHQEVNRCSLCVVLDG